MVGYRGDMQCINLCFGRKNRAGHDFVRDSNNLGRIGQQRNSGQCLNPFSSQCWIPSGRFIEYILRHNELVAGSFRVPPFVRQ